MDAQDRLMSKFSSFNFFWRKDMPDEMSGYTYGRDIYINAHKPYPVQTQTMGEEVGHAETTVGNITRYSTANDAHQEVEARRFGMEQTVTLDDLIDLYKDEYDAANPTEALGVTKDYLDACLDHYRVTKGERFTYHGYEFDLRHGLNIWPEK